MQSSNLARVEQTDAEFKQMVISLASDERLTYRERTVMIQLIAELASKGQFNVNIKYLVRLNFAKYKEIERCLERLTELKYLSAKKCEQKNIYTIKMGLNVTETPIIEAANVVKFDEFKQKHNAGSK